ncbi:MAG TPA: hypothetical protein EYN67_03230 [Flavobacteriales bacterium]|nr:hypothetical protein [Flavobacteriales bacterium]
MNKFKKILLVLTLIFISISAIAAPTMPGSIKVSGVTHNSVKIEWQESISMSGEGKIIYEVKMRIRHGDKPSEWGFHGGCCLANKSNVVISGLLPETKYEIRVVAYDSSGENSKARIKENAFTTLEKPTTYQVIKSFPVGFSMVSIPFKFVDNTVKYIFGDEAFFNAHLTIYKYSQQTGFVINSYDADFGWDDESMVLEPGEAIWILNNSPTGDTRHRAFRGNVSDKWREIGE